MEVEVVAVVNPATDRVHLMHKWAGERDGEHDRYTLCGRLVKRAVESDDPLAAATAPTNVQQMIEVTSEELAAWPNIRPCASCERSPYRRLVTRRVPSVDPASASRTPGKLMDVATIAREYGISRRAAEAIMRQVPSVEIEGLRKVYVKRADVEAYVEARIRPARR